MSDHFADRLAARQLETRSIACVGLDPRPDWIPAEFQRGGSEARAGAGEARGADARAADDPGRAFSEAVVELLRGRAAAIKPQLAFFDDEPEAPFALSKLAGRDFISVADAKRGDIGSTAEAYAARWLGADSPWDALTVNPFLGRDSLEPFVAEAEKHGRGLFVLVKTSNKGAADIQDQVLASGERVFERVARLVDELGANKVGAGGYSLVGAVVGATADPAAVARLRELMPRAIFLMPGYGAQGGSREAIARAQDPRGLGVLVPSSRALTFPWKTKDAKASPPADWRAAVRAELDRMNADLGLKKATV